MQHWNGILLHGMGLIGEYLMIRKRVKAGCCFLGLAAGLSRLVHGIYLMSGPFCGGELGSHCRSLHMLTISGGLSIGESIDQHCRTCCYTRGRSGVISGKQEMGATLLME